MKCNNCGSALAEGALFCPHCGSSVAPVPVEPAAPAAILDQSYTPTPVQSNSAWAASGDNTTPCMIFCGHCGNQVPEGTTACTACGLPPTTVVAPPPQKKKSHLGLWILAAVASVLIIVVIAGLCTNWFGFYGPATQIFSAADNTLTSGSFTIDLSMSTEYNSGIGNYSKQIDGTIEVVLNAKDRELMLYGELESEGETATIAIYDNYVVSKSGDFYNKQDISEELEEFFDSYESTKELDWEELLNSIDEGLYDEVSDVIDFDKLEKCLTGYGRKLNDTAWLKEYAGYSFSKENGEKLHQFKPKTYKFLNASLACFEDAFEDEDDYENLMGDMKDNKSDLNSVDFEVVVGIKSNKLTTFKMAMEQERSTTKLALEFDKIGKTSIDEDNLEEMLSKAS